MRNLLYSCFSKTDRIYVDTLEMFKTEADNYKRSYRVDGVLKDTERDYFDFIIRCWESSGCTPDSALFEGTFPETQGAFVPGNVSDIPVNNLRVYMFNIIDNRINAYIHDTMASLNNTVKKHGITQEISREFDRLQQLSNRNKSRDIDINIDSKAVYEDMKLRPLGMVTGIKKIDERIGGMNPGTVTTIAGFTSQYKTTFALNIARLNAYYFGYNIAYLSLETPKNDMNWNLLSCHSYEPTLSDFNFVGHDKMRKCMMIPEEEKFVFDVVEKDLKSDIQLTDGSVVPRGRIVFLDESDFDSFSFGEITAVLEQVDDKLKASVGKGLDAVIVDYIQLCKFSGSGFTSDANAQINSYVTFFRRMGQSFRKEVDANGNETNRSLIMILLSQINRDNWRRARNNNGQYDITCLADANELERGSYRVFTTYTTEDMKERHAAQVQILKNRTGQTMYEPATVYADGEAYVFLDEDSMNKTLGGAVGAANGQLSIEAAFNGFDENGLNDLIGSM